MSLPRLAFPVGLAAAFSLGLLGLLALGARDARAASPALDPVRATGVPTHWRVTMNGTVVLRLGGPGSDGAWFEARPDATGRAEVERLVLDVILSSEASGKVLTAVGKRERALDGQSVEDAFPLLWLERP